MKALGISFLISAGLIWLDLYLSYDPIFDVAEIYSERIHHETWIVALATVEGSCY
jgi:hypothetical protein